MSRTFHHVVGWAKTLRRDRRDFVAYNRKPVPAEREAIAQELVAMVEPDQPAQVTQAPECPEFPESEWFEPIGHRFEPMDDLGNPLADVEAMLDLPEWEQALLAQGARPMPLTRPVGHGSTHAYPFPTPEEVEAARRQMEAEERHERDDDDTCWMPTVARQDVAPLLGNGWHIVQPKRPSRMWEPPTQLHKGANYVRVYELARMAGMTSKEMLRCLAERGEYQRNHMGMVASVKAKEVLADLEATERRDVFGGEPGDLTDNEIARLRVTLTSPSWLVSRG